jgi:pimeloyl-ACP methyl ester carboxylesterase
VTRQAFSVDVNGGYLSGWTEGDGVPILVLHGGPGMGVDYLSGLIAELAPRHQVASYQQRGLEPSTAGAPYDVATQVEDVVSVLDGLGWDRVIVVGHSWGGHLLLHLMVRHPARVAGACVVEPLGGVGDGGMAEFEAEIRRRTPPEDCARADALDQLALSGRASQEEQNESLRLVWPAYFPSHDSASPYCSIPMSSEAYGATFESLIDELPRLADGLKGCRVPTVFVHGSASPMPVTASTATSDLLADTAVEIVDGAGHFIWLDRPGAVVGATERLHRRIDTTT